MDKNLIASLAEYYANNRDFNSLSNLLKDYDDSQNNNFPTKETFKVKPEIKDGKIVLVIGDLHAPFGLKGYLEFCKEQYIKYNCDEVVFIGDEIDYHATSFHTSDPNGYGAGHEFMLAKADIAKWYKAFPKATVIIGNHTRMVARKAQVGGIPSEWIKTYEEALGTPNWKFVIDYEIDGVMYYHGEGSTARTKAKTDGKSVVQGHRHSEFYCEYINNNMFGMQIGTGIDKDAYAFAYGKAGKEPMLGCGVVKYGKEGILCKMPIKK